LLVLHGFTRALECQVIVTFTLFRVQTIHFNFSPFTILIPDFSF
jgi:hypothetical protein